MEVLNTLQAGAIIVCGGGERFWRPNANCWQLVAGDTSAWRDIPQVTTMFQLRGLNTHYIKQSVPSARGPGLG